MNQSVCDNCGKVERDMELASYYFEDEQHKELVECVTKEILRLDPETILSYEGMHFCKTSCFIEYITKKLREAKEWRAKKK